MVSSQLYCISFQCSTFIFLGTTSLFVKTRAMYIVDRCMFYFSAFTFGIYLAEAGVEAGGSIFVITKNFGTCLRH